MSPFAKKRSDSVAAIGEARLIDRIQAWLGPVSPPPPAGIGDDCAVVRAPREPLLVKVDPIVYRRHFDDSVPAGSAAGKLLKRNLSDIAAMGGRPTVAVVALFLDRRTSVSWLGRFYRGLAVAAQRYGVQVVGGGIAETPGTFAASLTLLGHAPSRRVLTRRGARAADRIFVSGLLGRSRESRHHYRFIPRLAEGRWLVNQPGVRALIDVSDGLAKDLWSITPKGCVPSINPAAVPRRHGATLAQALGDGEDYELLFAAAPEADPEAFQRRWRKAFPKTPLSEIGTFVHRGKISPEALDLSPYRGYEHLR